MSTAKNPWIGVVGLAGATMVTVTAELAPTGLLLGVAADTGVSVGVAGQLVTAWALTVAAVSLPLTLATRRVDRRTLLVAALVIAGIATLVAAAAPSYPILLAARIVAASGHGLFWAQVVVVGSGLVAPGRAARAVAIIVAGPTVASVALVPAVTAVGLQAGWRAPFAAIGVLILLAAGGVTRLLRRLAAAPRSPRTARTHGDPTVPPVVVTAILGGVLLVAHFAAFTFIAPILTEASGLASEGLSLALLVFGAAGVGGLVITPPVVRRWPRAALTLTGVALITALVALLAPGGAVTTLAAVAAWGVVIGALPVIYQTRVLGLASDDFRPVAGAASVVVLNLGVAGGAALGAAVADGGGTALLVPVAILVAVAGTIGLAAQLALTARAARLPTPMQ